jgi:6-phosphogluconolactonase
VCKLQFPVNTVLTLTAVADAGSAFGSWNAPCEPPLEPGKCKITLTGDVLVNAVFTLIPFEFALSGTPASQSVAQGGTAEYTITATLVSGMANQVTLAVQSGCPVNATCTFSQPLLTPTIGGATSTLTVSTAGGTPEGQASLVVTASDGGAVQQTTLQLSVTAAATTFAFSLSASPLSQPVGQGAAASFSVTATLTGGAPEQVALSVAGCPAAATCTFNPTDVTPTGGGTTSTLTAATGGATPLGDATLEITASGGGVTQQISVLLTTNAPVTGGMSPPRFAYVANNSDGTLSIFAVNAMTGQFRHRGYVPASLLPVSVAADPSGKFIYVAGQTQTGRVSGYAVTAATGVLVPIVGSPFTAGSLTSAVVAHPNGQFLYAVNFSSPGQPALSEGTVSAFNIGPDGALMPIPGSPFPAGKSPTAMVIDPDGKFAYVANFSANTAHVTAFAIQPNGALQALALQNIPVNPSAAIGVDPSGKFLFTANEIDDSVSAYAINTATGTLARVQGSPFGSGGDPNSLAVDLLSRFLYVSNESSKNVSGYAINAATGRLTALPGSPYPVGAVPQSISVDPSGHFVYTTNFDAQPGDLSNNTITIFSIDQSTGALAPAGVTRGREEPSAMAFIKGPPPVTFTPTFAYTANYGGNDLSGFQIDAADGHLTSLGAFPAGSTPRSAAIMPNGKFLYVANEFTGQANGQVSGFAIQPTGTLNPVGQPVPAGQEPSAATVEPSGRFVYVTNRASGNVSGFRLDQTTGSLTSLGGNVGAQTNPVSVAADPTGQFLYVVNRGTSTVQGTVSAYRIDESDGSLTPTGAVPQVGTSAEGGTVDPTGRFMYVASSGSARIYGFRVRPDGGLEAMPGSPFTTAAAPVALAVEPAGKYLFVANRDANTLSVFRIDSSTGALSLLATVGAGTRPDAVTVDISGTFVYVATLGSAQPAGPGAVTAFSLDQGTGVLSPVPGSPFPTGAQPVAISTTGTIQ